MSDKHLHDDTQDQSWTGGPDTPRYGALDRAHEGIAEPPASHAAQEALGDEREAGYWDYYLRMPPLQGASWERLELCRDALALALMDAGIGIRLAKELAARCTARLQEPFDK